MTITVKGKKVVQVPQWQLALAYLAVVCGFGDTRLWPERQLYYLVLSDGGEVEVNRATYEGYKVGAVYRPA